MKMATHVSINLFPLVMLLIIFFNNLKNSKASDRRHFNMLTVLTIGLIVFDILRAGFGDMDVRWVNQALWISHFFYLECVVSVSCDWLIYVCARLKVLGSHEKRRRITYFVTGVDIFFNGFALTNPWTGYLFVITQDGQFQKGVLYYLPYIISVSLILTTMVIVFYRYRGEVSKERRRECLYLLMCGFPPLVGIGMQQFLRDWWIGSTFVSLALLFIYLNAQNRQITTDALTGLNNRLEFDQQITKKSEQTGGNNWGLFMLDVDDFKLINDTFGHAVGDEALWVTADILRNALGREKCFLARYGGDEFAVIGDWEDEQEARTMIVMVEDELAKFNQKSEMKYKLSFSIGYALWRETGNIEGLIGKADERMYAIKARKKKKVHKSD